MTEQLAAAVQEYYEDAEGKLKPPHGVLSKEAIPFWNDIISRRLRIEWPNSDLNYVVNVAEFLALMQRERVLLLKEGTVIGTGANSRANPRIEGIVKLNLAVTKAMAWLGVAGRMGRAAQHLSAQRALQLNRQKEIEIADKASGRSRKRRVRVEMPDDDDDDRQMPHGIMNGNGDNPSGNDLLA